jgi:hypothetical protein
MTSITIAQPRVKPPEPRGQQLRRQGPPAANRLLTAREVAAWLAVSTRTLYRVLRGGTPPLLFAVVERASAGPMTLGGVF